MLEQLGNILTALREFGGIPFTIITVIFTLSVIITPFAILSIHKYVKDIRDQSITMNYMFFTLFFNDDGTLKYTYDGNSGVDVEIDDTKEDEK